MTCAFRLSDGSDCARQQAAGQHFCVLHHGFDTPPGRTLPSNPYFQAEFDKLVAAKDGQWKGFVFPADLRWPKEVGFSVDARRCRFGGLELDHVEFNDTVDFSDTVFDDTVALRGVIFHRGTTLDRCRFDGPVELLNVRFLGIASFRRVEFAARAILRVNFSAAVNFNEAVFRDTVRFSGWRNINLRVSAALVSAKAHIAGAAANRTRPTIFQAMTAALWDAIATAQRVLIAVMEMGKTLRTKATDRLHRLRRRYARHDRDTEHFRVFAAEGQLQDVIFMKPEQTVFADVDLANVFLRGTNLRGVRFQGVNWWQARLGRNGLHDESFIHESADGPFRYQSLPALEDACRNVRVALEESRNFEAASDFYVAELEARRARLVVLRRHVLSIPAVYRAVSFYGTNVGTAFRMLCWYVLLHALVTSLLMPHDPNYEAWAVLRDASLRSVQILIFQSTNFQWNAAEYGQFIADSLLRVLGVIQMAMLVFAFRSRIKRH